MMRHNNCNDPKTKFKPKSATPLGQVDLLVSRFDNFKKLCPWTDDSGKSCMAISCTGLGGKNCEPKNCGLLYLANYLKG